MKAVGALTIARVNSASPSGLPKAEMGITVDTYCMQQNSDGEWVSVVDDSETL